MTGRVSVPGVPHKSQGELKTEVLSRSRGALLTTITTPCNYADKANERKKERMTATLHFYLRYFWYAEMPGTEVIRMKSKHGNWTVFLRADYAIYCKEFQT